MKLAAVVIGRNEGERLTRAIEALRAHAPAEQPDLPIVYADSDSDDGSPERAEAAGAVVHRLDPSIPMNASRGRAEGAAVVRERFPDAEEVYFVDGDCVTEPGFLDAALEALRRDDRLGAVCGWRREAAPNASLYNRLQDLEWHAGAVGDTDSCGGDSVMRLAALDDAGGWDPTVLAGEEPQLCARLRANGWTVRRLDVPMTVHDAAMTSLSQWLRRERRTGYGVADVVRRFGAAAHPQFASIQRSARIWTLGVLAAGLLIATGAAALLARADLAWLGLALGYFAVIDAYLLLVFKTGRWYTRQGLGVNEAIMAGTLNALGKWWQLAGQFDRWREGDRPRGGSSRVEKQPASAGTPRRSGGERTADHRPDKREKGAA